MLELILDTFLGRFLPKMTRFKGSLDISLDKIDKKNNVRAESLNLIKQLPVGTGALYLRFWGVPNPSKFDKEFMNFPDHSWDRFLMDFGTISAPSCEPKWGKNSI